MLKKLNFIALAAVALVATAARAEDCDLAVIDAQKIYQNNVAAEDIRNELQDLTVAAQKKINAMENDLRKKQESLQARRGALSEEKYAEEKLELTKAYREFRQEAQKIQIDLDKKGTEMKREITKQVRTVVEELAKEKGYKAVLQKSWVLYSDDAIDISEEVLKRVNKRLKK